MPMIQALFLSCALALPVAEFQHPPLTVLEIKILYTMSRMDSYPTVENRAQRKVLLVFVPSRWTDGFSSFFETYRLTSFPDNPRDIVSSYFNQPIRRNSMKIVIYGGPSGYSVWGAMKILSECLFALSPNGYFLYQERKCHQFAAFLESSGYLRLPIYWHGFDVYKKPLNPIRYRRNIQTIEEDA